MHINVLFSKMSKKLKQTYFKVSWLDSDLFKSWLCKTSRDTQARCKLCKVDISLSNVGIVAIKSHMNNKTRKKLESEQQRIKNFFSKKSEGALKPSDKQRDEYALDSEVSKVSSTETQSTIPHSLQGDGKLTAKMRWALKHVFCGYSDNSVKDSINTFKVMFPDSKIASKMELGKDKLKYVVNYGNAPFFAEGLKK